MKKNKLSKKFISISFVAVILIIILFNVNTLKSQVLHLYDFKLFPENGFALLEQEYKLNYDMAEKARVDANSITMMLGVSGLDVEQIFNDYTNIDKLHILRKHAFEKMLEVDNECLSLNLDEEYHEFCDLRKEADQKSFESFQIYREGMEYVKVPSLSFNKYLVKRKELGKLMGDFSDSSADWETISHLIPTLRKFMPTIDTLYQTEIKPLYTNYDFPEELINAINDDFKFIKLEVSATIAYIDDEDNGLLSQFQQASLEPRDNSYELFMVWASNHMQQVTQQQGEGHNSAYFLLQKAYNYATKKSFSVVIDQIWGEDNPINYQEKSSLIDYAINDPKNTEEMKQDLRSYTYSYTEPSVVFIRTALTDYLQDGQNITILQQARDSLDEIDNELLNGKFIVLYIDHKASGNRVIHEIWIVFPDHQEQKYVVKIVEKDENFSLASFDGEKFGAEEFQQLNEASQMFLNDEKYRL